MGSFQNREPSACLLLLPENKTQLPRDKVQGWSAAALLSSLAATPLSVCLLGELLHLLSLQTYIRSMDKDFVAATIQAIGRCATNIGKVRDTCLNGLVQLLSNRDGETLLSSGGDGSSVGRAGTGLA